MPTKVNSETSSNMKQKKESYEIYYGLETKLVMVSKEDEFGDIFNIVIDPGNTSLNLFDMINFDDGEEIGEALGFVPFEGKITINHGEDV